MAETARYLIVKVALSESEKAKLQEEAEAEGLSLACIIRRRALRQDRAVPTGTSTGP